MKKSSIANQLPLTVGLLVLVAVSVFFLTTQFYVSDKSTISIESNLPQITPETTTQLPSEKLKPVDVLLTGLKQRLEQQADDVDGWILLSKSYFHLNRLDEAKAAYEQAKALGYTGNWQPLPRIDSFSKKEPVTSNLNSIANFRNHKIGKNGG
ncbi:MAG: hypothetical protein GY806_17705 [Gammaproteobacteria bacterium]|nr:hypothetical protein [Gammaproteobacteria bacterium]